MKKGVTKASLNEICARVGRMQTSAVCDFEGDPENGIGAFTINCTEIQLAEINREVFIQIVQRFFCASSSWVS